MPVDKCDILTIIKILCKNGEMARRPYIDRIQSRITELQDEIGRNQAELEELQIAARVIDRLSGDDDKPGFERPDPYEPFSIADLIIIALGEIGPMETSAIHQILEKKFGRATTINTVGSTLSRLKSEGKLTLIDRNWQTLLNTLTKDKAPNADAPGPLTIRNQADHTGSDELPRDKE